MDHSSATSNGIRTPVYGNETSNIEVEVAMRRRLASENGSTMDSNIATTAKKILRNSRVKHRLFRENNLPIPNDVITISEAERNDDSDCQQISQSAHHSRFNSVVSAGSDTAVNDRGDSECWRGDPTISGASENHRRGKSGTNCAVSTSKQRGRKRKRVSGAVDVRRQDDASEQAVCDEPSDRWLGRRSYSYQSTSSDDDVMDTSNRAASCVAQERNSNSKSTHNSKDVPPTTLQCRDDSEVDIDREKLLSIFERVVDATETSSVEEMEKLLSTFNHLVFRYRMRRDRQQLTTDLELAADMFLRQTHDTT
jgi:hypothetical protein